MLITFLHTDQSKDKDSEILRPDIDVYLHELTVEQVNVKLRHIHDNWQRNLPALNPRLIIRTAKIIEFIATYPIRRKEIILKLSLDASHDVQTFDLDICAMCHDGTNLLMLSRCTRALEIDYNVFTMILIWDHHFGNRRESRIHKVLKYANRGFGIRIFPRYAGSLEKKESAIQDLTSQSSQLSICGEGDPGLKVLTHTSSCVTFSTIMACRADMAVNISALKSRNIGKVLFQ